MNRLAWFCGKWDLSSAGWRWGGAWVTWFVVVLAVVAVAERVGKSRKWIVDVERGVINPTLRSVIDVCRVLDFSLSVSKQKRPAGSVDLLALVLGRIDGGRRA